MKKKIPSFGFRRNDDDDDYDDNAADEKQSAVTLFNPSLVDAFADSYDSSPCEEVATETYNYGSLRDFFNAYPVPKLGDPLQKYIAALHERGFSLRTSYCGEPSIFVRCKEKEVVDCDGFSLN